MCLEYLTDALKYVTIGMEAGADNVCQKWQMSEEPWQKQDRRQIWKREEWIGLG